jgi:3-oxoacyl-[acyl-carrier protein] reductase
LKVLAYLIEIAVCRGISAHIPLGRTASPSEIAALVLWLVGGEGAQLMTGETVVSSGGMLM